MDHIGTNTYTLNSRAKRVRARTLETAYGAGLTDLDWYAEGDKYVVIDQLRTPLHPESYSD